MATILVIDDDAEIRALIRDILESEGHEVVEADDGTTGLKAFDSRSFDLVITDIIMQGKEGVETIMTMTKRLPAQRILAISGGGNIKKEETLILAAACGAYTLPKPFDATALMAAVTQLLR
jgi:two-component system, chemotaxis family, chemotaxis protein CheY